MYSKRKVWSGLVWSPIILEAAAVDGLHASSVMGKMLADPVLAF